MSKDGFLDPHESASKQHLDSSKLVYRHGPKLQNILRQSYDYLTIMRKLRSTYDGRLMYETSYEGRKAFLRFD